VVQSVSIVDLFPNFAGPAGAKLDERVQSQVEGRNLLPLLENPQAPWAERFLVTHVGRWGGMTPGKAPEKHIKFGCAIRNNRRTLIRGENEWQLYDLVKNHCQEKDIAAEKPDLVQSLSNACYRWWKEDQASLSNEDVYQSAATI
jgi:hypothetical protein